MSLSPPPDKICQWCKKVVAVGLGDGGWMMVASAYEFQGKYYCDKESGTCWTNLMAMAKYVRDNFHA